MGRDESGYWFFVRGSWLEKRLAGLVAGKFLGALFIRLAVGFVVGLDVRGFGRRWIV